ncbi:YdcF family protein [Desertivirga xinjiangensis]|uniref:YdcF family protein n=1 Tax=Desertivirga xinjiangensis TaxID=539206 RepID=UPI00210B755A|nr:YdcF family protein [Pedobacter xinjiangensis]
MKRIISLCFLLAGWHCLLASPPKTIMLILGSADPVVLQNRMDIAIRLYQKQSFDKIIVSGGCAAHGSSICEASFMSDALLKSGVPGKIIYKEENSKTTVQNYIFSRKLEEADGTPVILPGDTVFVVSDHWHAISVAARLRKYDKVEAKFYIEGSIDPKPSDKLDYGSIFNGEPDNEKFILKGTWLTPEAVWRQADSIYYLTGSLVYVTDRQNTRFSYYPRGKFFPALEDYAVQKELRFIDAGSHWYVWNGEQLLNINKQDKKIKGVSDLSTLIPNVPAKWKNSLKAGFIDGDKLLLFSDTGVLVGRKKGKIFVIEQEASAPNYFTGWPYAWGQGNVSAVMVDAANRKLYVYRNQEYMELGGGLKILEGPKSLRLKWIDLK